VTTILVVDDERPLVDLVRGYLEREGFRVAAAFDGDEALRVARQESPDLIVLDLMLPEVDGLEVCRQVRQFSDAYVLVLTARSDEIDRVVGLSVGADDYVTKPFSPRELVARVHALLRRPRGLRNGHGQRPEEETRLTLGDLVIDRTRHEVLRGGSRVPLTRLEFELLIALAGFPGKVYSREELIERVWGEDFFGDEHVVDVHMSNLRRKLEPDPAEPSVIETVRGVGYRLHRPDG
jgi:DNA-binding response OmpR family regulator